MPELHTAPALSRFAAFFKEGSRIWQNLLILYYLHAPQTFIQYQPFNLFTLFFNLIKNLTKLNTSDLNENMHYKTSVFDIKSKEGVLKIQYLRVPG